jgi:uncharacterized protein
MIASATLAAFIGAFAGSRLLGKMTIHTVRIIVAVMLLLIALLLLGLGLGLIWLIWEADIGRENPWD